MTRYARVVDGSVVELFDLPDGFQIPDCFHPGLSGQWLECTDAPDVSERWTHDGYSFHPPEHQE